jgi:hypothetical protein
MDNLICFICETCGTQFPESAEPPASCPICQDERQYLGNEGQSWTTLAALRQGHRNRIEELEPGLVGIGSEPDFAIGQRAMLVWTGDGNLLWDCISLLDDDTVAAVNALGGIRAIAISHPHFYSSMIEWAHAFDAPVLLHRADREHVMRPDPAIELWEGETTDLFGGLTLIRGGGHFEGGTMLHWAAGGGGRGALLSGDIIQVVADRRWVSFMYSYPNVIPLSPSKVREVVAAVEPFEFDRIYGAWWERVVSEGGKDAVRRSAERYIRFSSR